MSYYLKKHSNKKYTITVRLDEQDYNWIKSYAEEESKKHYYRRSINISDIVRNLILEKRRSLK